MSPLFIPVILAGGKGERFWPLSRRLYPKQFLSLDGTGVSLLQGTADRLLSIAQGWENLWVITAAHLAEGVHQQLPDLPLANVLVEPEGRDTAPAVAWATVEVAKHYGESAVVGFFPADHWIDDRAEFEQTLMAAVTLAQEQGAIVTLGIQPAYPATGYGYIEQGDGIGTFGDKPAYRVARFTEKPDLATAQAFVESGRFSWNGGIFIFQTGVGLQELNLHAPEVLKPLSESGVAAYPTLPKISIDYALMEKTQRACVLPVQFGWDDLGDWNALSRLLEQDSQGNVAIGTHEHLDSQGCVVYNDRPEEAIVTLGLEDVVVVRAGNATLVAHKSRTQDIKAVLKQLQGLDQRLDLL
jgi:mannose-1-phosphate guanylyltransferase